jgi:cell division transport system ATP-binding protein
MIRLDKVGLHYGRGGPEVLSEIDLVLEPGAFCWLLGPSGAGKTSLLRLMYLAARPTSGQLSMLGCDVGAADRPARMALRRRIGVVFQDFRLLPGLSTFDNLALPLRIAGRDEAQLRENVWEMLDWVGLAHKADAPTQELSGGEQQRAAIARAVIASPAILLADEPTGNLDDVQAERLMVLLREMNRLGTTVVVATHNAALAARHKGQILRLAEGRLAEGRLAEGRLAEGRLAEGRLAPPPTAPGETGTAIAYV